MLEGLGLDPAAVPVVAAVDAAVAALAVGARGRRCRSPVGRGQYAAVAPRRELDAALVDARPRRRRRGARRPRRSSASTERRPTASCSSSVDGLGPSRARYVIGADGMWSPLRKARSASPSRATSASGTPSASTSPASTGPAAEQLWVWFEPDLLPGYAWSFPLPGGRANVGFGVLRGDGRRGRRTWPTWPDLLARPHCAPRSAPGAEPEGRHTAWPIPARVDRAVLGRRARAVRRRRRRRHRPAHRRGHRPGAAHAASLAAEAIAAAGALTPAPSQAPLPRRRAPPASCADHRMSVALRPVLRRGVGRAGAVRVAGLSPMDAAQLRPLDVRGRAAGRAAHPAPLAPPLPRLPGAYLAHGRPGRAERLSDEVGADERRPARIAARPIGLWAADIVPPLQDYITIPNVSQAYDADWAEHGHMDRAVELIRSWCAARPIAGHDRRGPGARRAARR